MPTIIAVHGNGGGGERFARIGPLLPVGFALRAPTLPGFGGVPLGDVDRLDGLTDALEAEVAASTRPRLLLGHGVGGAVALDLLSRDPRQVDGLILHAPVGTRLDTRLFPRVMSSRRVQRTVQGVIAHPLARPLLRRIALPEVPRDIADRTLAAYGRAEAFGRLFDWLDSAWFDALPPLVELPAAVLWGERDRVLDAEQRGDYQRLLPGAREVVVPGWGHFPMLDRPEAYARMLTELSRALLQGGRGDPGSATAEPGDPAPGAPQL